MSPTTDWSRLCELQQETITTTCFLSNLHCPSCVRVIHESLAALEPSPENILVSILSHSVALRHTASLAVNDISESLEAAGFEVHSIFQNDNPVELHSSRKQNREWSQNLVNQLSHYNSSGVIRGSEEEARKRKLHLTQCEQCKREHGGISLAINNEDVMPLNSELVYTTLPKVDCDGTSSLAPISPIMDDSVDVEPATTPAIYKATLTLSGMTCSSCVNSIRHAVLQLPWVRSVDVNLITNSGIVIFDGAFDVSEITQTIESCGFDVNLENLEETHIPSSKIDPHLRQRLDTWRATYTVGGMTCSSCVGNVTAALNSREWIKKVDVNLLSNSAAVTFVGKEHLLEIKESIETMGYDAALDTVIREDVKEGRTEERAIAIRIGGMFCHHCPGDITRKLKKNFEEHPTLKLEDSNFSLSSPVLRIRYVPDSPRFTIRHIFDAIVDLNSAFEPSIHHPPTIEERARQMHAEERKRTLFRLILCTFIAVPTFILGIVFMSLVKSTNSIRKYLMTSIWAGNATRLNWALFMLAVPVFFFAADTFHRRAFREVRAMWRRGSRTSIRHRFVRFGSMNMLISLGTSIAFFASIAELILAATRKSPGSMNDSYFDAVVFLTLFILVGRYLEAYSKARTGDAVTSLGKLRPNESILVDSQRGDTKITTDLLDVGDIVRVHYGTSPPFDGIVLDGSATFDESSLTGESKPAKKEAGDIVYSGTINKSAPIKIKITTVSGTSMLDQIISAVREGQTRRAPVEHVADTITSHFVPLVIIVAIITWLVWLILGTTGAVPKDWKDEGAGGWALWSLRFAIAVFVIACPCGIGLAAPTALFVGGGLAAKHGILVRGGGEAFQEASSLDCVVFDKTGTLTQGGDPSVTDHSITGSHNGPLILGVVRALEENSNHPIARALATFCSDQAYRKLSMVNVDEVPGKGLKGTFRIDGEEIIAIVGNETLMADYHVPISSTDASKLQIWKSRGESIALVAICLSQSSHEPTMLAHNRPESSTSFEVLSVSTTMAPPSPVWRLACIFSIADPLRPEAIGVVSALKKRDIDVWILSGDNPVTANAVGAQVGIPASNIIAGVLPEQKAEKIKHLQQTLRKTRKTAIVRVPFLSNMKSSKANRATIAMIGDGINDAPALSTADVSIAIGSGSDIALSSSSFILINSHLTTVLTLLDLSRVVFRRVYFNFGWALIYNLIAMPVAAGVLFPITTGTKGMDMDHNGDGMKAGGVKHIRLDPVWASLAMALSSLSVVCSSLALRSNIPGVGFRTRKESVLEEDTVTEQREVWEIV